MTFVFLILVVFGLLFGNIAIWHRVFELGFPYGILYFVSGLVCVVPSVLLVYIILLEYASPLGWIFKRKSVTESLLNDQGGTQKPEEYKIPEGIGVGDRCPHDQSGIMTICLGGCTRWVVCLNDPYGHRRPATLEEAKEFIARKS